MLSSKALYVVRRLMCSVKLLNLQSLTYTQVGYLCKNSLLVLTQPYQKNGVHICTLVGSVVIKEVDVIKKMGKSNEDTSKSQVQYETVGRFLNLCL